MFSLSLACVHDLARKDKNKGTSRGLGACGSAMGPQMRRWVFCLLGHVKASSTLIILDLVKEAVKTSKSGPSFF